MLKISTEIGSASHIVGEERAIEQIARAGFDAWDFSMFSMASYDWGTGKVRETGHPLTGGDYAAFAQKLRHIGEECGIRCNQSHAPFPSMIPAIHDRLKRAIECTAIAGGEICVIHPDNHRSAEENAEMYLELLPFAKECGVKIATENMWNWTAEGDHAAPAACSHHTDFLAHMRAVNDPDFVACLDIGHAEMKGLDTSSRQMILTLGEHLQALHLHDNDCWHDSHRLPFTGDIDFGAVARSLREIGYKGYLTLECDQALHGYTADNISDGLRAMASAARRLGQMIEEN